MATEKASKWVIGIVIYFTILSTIIGLVNEFNEEYELEQTELIDTNIQTLSYIPDNFTICALPRFDQGLLTKGETYNAFRSTAYLDNCIVLQEFGLTPNNDTCEQYVGCEWKEDTIFFIFGTGSFSCTGNIDLEYYNDNSTESVYGGSIYDQQVCSLTQLNEDEELCKSFGCTFYDKETLDEVVAEAEKEKNTGLSGVTSKVWNIINKIWDIATFQISFGFSNSYLNALLSFILVWVPITALIFSIKEIIKG